MAKFFTTGAMPVFLVLAVAVSALSMMMRRSSKGQRRFAEGKVTGITGRKGHGKTIFGVHELLRHVNGKHYCRECSKNLGHRAAHQGTIASNGNLMLSGIAAERYVHVESWSDLLDLPHGTLVMLDEVQNGWAPATAGQVFPELPQWILTQCRKLHIEVIWITQDWGNVSAGLRRLTDEIARCHKSYFRQMAVRFYDIAAGTPNFKEKPLWKYSYRVTSELANSYDTYELLKPSTIAASSITVEAAEQMITRRRGGVHPTESGALPDVTIHASWAPTVDTALT